MRIWPLNRSTRVNLSALVIFAFIALANTAYASGLKKVDLLTDNIRYLGTKYVYHNKVDNQVQVSFTRHEKALLALPKKETNFNSLKAQSNTGIIINFATDSNKVELDFSALNTVNRGSELAIYENDVYIKSLKFSAKKTDFSVVINSKNADALSEYKVVLPSLANLALTAFKISPSSTLTKIASKRKAKYIALGDSITHGVGQGSASYLTYPFQLAQALDLELFNLAVGGAQVSPITADMVKDFSNVELITVLVGYNDWNAPNADLAIFKAKYEQLLTSLVRHHPNSKIYCITPLFTKREKAQHSTLPLQSYRDVIVDLVKQKQVQHPNIKWVNGDEVSSIKNLRTDNTSDPVHLGINGAKLLAQQLVSIIK